MHDIRCYGLQETRSVMIAEIITMQHEVCLCVLLQNNPFVVRINCVYSCVSSGLRACIKCNYKKKVAGASWPRKRKDIGRLHEFVKIWMRISAIACIIFSPFPNSTLSLAEIDEIGETDKMKRCSSGSYLVRKRLMCIEVRAPSYFLPVRKGIHIQLYFPFLTNQCRNISRSAVAFGVSERL
jgi:hypothetical protein